MSTGPISAKTTVTGPTASGAANLLTGTSKLIESQATDNSKSSQGNFEDKSVTTVNTTTADPAVAKAAIDAVNDASKAFGTQLTDLVKLSGTQTSEAITKSLGAISSLAQGQQQQVADNNAAKDTGGATRFSKPILIGLAMLAAVVVFFIWRKKS